MKKKSNFEEELKKMIDEEAELLVENVNKWSQKPCEIHIKNNGEETNVTCNGDIRGILVTLVGFIQKMCKDIPPLNIDMVCFLLQHLENVGEDTGNE